ncbi:MAG: hypothetical protein P1Q69_06525 [Candidatus Thorarchaeota archaeon]|nr:hypothetical protein [Candidatus Thorarchaeota archaeon]
MAKVEFPFVDTKGKTRVLSVNDSATRIEFTNKGIASIDLTPMRQCLRLRDLLLYGNDIPQLDLTPLAGCTMLQTLVLRENRLQTLDLSPLNEHIQLIRIDLRKNQLQSLNVDPMANKRMLEKFTIEGNPIMEIDVSALITCRKLKDVDIARHTKVKADRSLLNALRGPLRSYKNRIIWIDRQTTQNQQQQDPQHMPSVSSTVKTTVLGLLMSVPRISMDSLSQHCGVSPDEARELVFVLVGKGEVAGRYDPDSDEFISLVAVQTARELRSDGPTVHQCQYCSSPLSRALTAGDRLVCESCGQVNEG